MSVGPPAPEVRVALDVAKPDRCGVFQHHAEQPVRLGEVADGLPRRLADARHDELREPALPVGDTQGRIPRPDQTPGRVDDLLQDRFDRSLGSDCQDGIAYRPEGAAPKAVLLTSRCLVHGRTNCRTWPGP